MVIASWALNKSMLCIHKHIDKKSWIILLHIRLTQILLFSSARRDKNSGQCECFKNHQHGTEKRKAGGRKRIKKNGRTEKVPLVAFWEVGIMTFSLSLFLSFFLLLLRKLFSCSQNCYCFQNKNINMRETILRKNSYFSIKKRKKEMAHEEVKR